MKNKFLLFCAAVAAAVTFVACEPQTQDEVTNISFNIETAQVAVDSVFTLQVVFEPAGTTADITWESSKLDVATVVDGKVTAIAEGTAIIAASAAGKTATCLVTVTKKGTEGGNPDASLQGTEYYPIVLDAQTAEKLGDKIIYDFRPDDVTRFLYVWDGANATYNAVEPTGLNYYGNTEGYTSFTVLDKGWAGLGMTSPGTNVELLYEKVKDNLDDYYFHIAMKATDKCSHCFYLFGIENNYSKFVIGDRSVYDGKPIADFPRDGEWHAIEFPLSQIDISAFKPANELNFFVALSDNFPGAMLNIDACFIYKK